MSAPDDARPWPVYAAFVCATRDELLTTFLASPPSLQPPLPFVEMGNYGLQHPDYEAWWESLLDFYLWLAPDDLEVRALVDEEVRALEEDSDEEPAPRAIERAFPSLATKGPVDICAVPSRLLPAAAALVDDQHLDQDTERCSERWLHELSALARQALGSGRSLWFWGYNNSDWLARSR